VIWRFQVHPDRVAEFERRYGPAGDWAQLFGRGEGYRGTELLQDTSDPLVYVTVDWWENVAAFDAFRAEHADAYGALDAACESLTREETRVGSFIGI
jgi:heme-degrading monooxygenase HmoA